LGDKFWLWDDYTRAKIAAEKIVWEAHGKRGLGLTIIRPSWLYGPRDRLSIRRIAKTLRKGRVRIIGDGTNEMNTVYAGNVAEACLLAAANPAANGQAYNVTKDGPLTQQEYFHLYADAFGTPRPTRHVSYALAYAGAWVLECLFRLGRIRRPPFITRYAVWLLGRHTVYSTEKAQRELGWQPRVGYREGIARTVAWYRDTHEGKDGPTASRGSEHAP
jgi:nucleoside-diphosphate-sugar epimerase